MSVKIIDLSKTKDKGFNTFEATFQVDGELQPLRVSEEDKRETFGKIEDLLKQENPDMEELSENLYSLMSPVANVKKSIESDFYLSENMSIVNGVIHFGEHVLEETLSEHMLSLLDDDNTPKDSNLWKSYVKFLDNLHQNVNAEIRKQLFRWIDYENKAGNGFGITDDGCIVGYKGCSGTILEPKSKFTGHAIVDGVEHEGHIPNKVGSVVQMPRSAVQFDPQVGCAAGLHVGTRDYAVKWAPVLILVKVNPRDIVSVPYEVQSQKMRVCEYTVLKTTDASEEHQRFYESTSPVENDTFDYSDEDADLELSYADASELEGKKIYVEYENGEKTFEGTVSEFYSDVTKPGIVIRSDADEYVHIKLNRITFYTTDFSDDDETVELLDEAKDKINEDKNVSIDITTAEELTELLDDFVDKEVIIKYDGKSAKGTLTSLYRDGANSGAIIETEDDGVKHIKYRRIDSIESQTQKSEDNFKTFIEALEDMVSGAIRVD